MMVTLQVTAATQPSFLQHAVYLDDTKNRLIVLGEVNRRFIVSPDVDLLLEDMLVMEEQKKKRRAEEAKKEDGLIRMDDQDEVKCCEQLNCTNNYPDECSELFYAKP